MTREADVKTEVIKFLKVTATRFFRLQAGRVKVKGGWFWMNEEGCPDFLILQTGIRWIELKSATGKQREAQKRFQAEAEAKGERYFLCRTLEEVVEAVIS